MDCVSRTAELACLLIRPMLVRNAQRVVLSVRVPADVINVKEVTKLQIRRIAPLVVRTASTVPMTNASNVQPQPSKP